MMAPNASYASPRREEAKRRAIRAAAEALVISAEAPVRANALPVPLADIGNGPIIVPGLVGAGDADDDEGRRGEGLTTVPEGNPTLAGRSVLIVEDEFVISMDLEHMLSDAGCEVVGVAADSAEAIRLAEANRPDFITMDINLRGGRDGIETAIEIYERFGIRSIFISAYSDSETVRRAGAARPLSWLPKPVSRAKLEAAMKALPEED